MTPQEIRAAAAAKISALASELENLSEGIHASDAPSDDELSLADDLQSAADELSETTDFLTALAEDPDEAKDSDQDAGEDEEDSDS